MLEETKMGSMQHGIYLDPKSERNFSGKSGEIWMKPVIQLVILYKL